MNRPRIGAVARIWPLLVLAVSAVLLTLADVRPAAAHAALVSSEPAANTVLPSGPAQVVLRFTEPLERSYSAAEVFDQTGTLVPGATGVAGADDYSMVVPLPANLANGTYSVVWRTLSQADGHTASGYVAFTVGTQADVRPVAPVATEIETSEVPDWARAGSRWLALLGLAGAVAVWPVWLLVLRPAISPAWQAGPALARRTKRFAALAIVFALVTDFIALVIQAQATAQGGLGERLQTTLLETRYGRIWLFRIGLLLVYASVLTIAAWWWPRRQKSTLVGGLVLAALLPIPFSLLAHAAARPEGKTTAIAFDVVHLLAASLWVGGLFVLLAALVPTLRDLTPAGRRVVLGRALPRFSAVALGAWALLGITGLYSAWLQVGNLEALRESAYGTSLTIKLLLLVPLLGLGAVHLFVVTRKVRHAPRGSDAGTVWGRRFAVVVALEVALVVVVLLVVGRLVGQPPARDVLAARAGKVTWELSSEGRDGTLVITPGAAGPNHYRLTLEGEPLPETAEAILRVQLADQRALDVALLRAAGNAFEAHGSELAATGDWTITAIVIEPGRPDWRATRALAVGTEPPAIDLPTAAWRFEPTGGLIGLGLLVGGVVLVVVAWRAGGTKLRREAAGLSVVALGIGLLVLTQARVEPEVRAGVVTDNPVPADEASVARGEAIYAANCLVCHGATGQGNGPGAAGLVPPPADFTIPHSMAHLDGDFAYWIENGIFGSAMPAFGDELTEEEIWDVINYIRVVFQGAGAAGTAGAAGSAVPVGTPAAGGTP